MLRDFAFFFFIDTAPTEFSPPPEPPPFPTQRRAPPASNRRLPAPSPADAVKHAPDDATHLILTYSHVFDLDICHAVLSQPFASAGLIGSATKWARFRRRLAALGHAPAQIARIACPIGDPSLGKHPAEIALGVATAMISRQDPMMKDRTA